MNGEMDLEQMEAAAVDALTALGVEMRGIRVTVTERTWTLSEIKTAWLRAEETGRPMHERPRDVDDLENGWAHLRGALTGEEV